MCPASPGPEHGRPRLQAQSRLLTPREEDLLQNARAVTFLAHFLPPLPTDHSPVPPLPLPSPRRKHQSAEKHRNCQMQFLSGDDKFAAICISKQELQFRSGSQAGSPPPTKASSIPPRMVLASSLLQGKRYQRLGGCQSKGRKQEKEAGAPLAPIGQAQSSQPSNGLPGPTLHGVNKDISAPGKWQAGPGLITQKS